VAVRSGSTIGGSALRVALTSNSVCAVAVTGDHGWNFGVSMCRIVHGTCPLLGGFLILVQEGWVLKLVFILYYF